MVVTAADWPSINTSSNVFTARAAKLAVMNSEKLLISATNIILLIYYDLKSTAK